jgi:hypothetical protein
MFNTDCVRCTANFEHQHREKVLFTVRNIIPSSTGKAAIISRALAVLSLIDLGIAYAPVRKKNKSS